MSQARPQAWWRQARNDLELAEMASRNGFHAQACFFATQAAEKALKGAIVELGLEPPHTHGLSQLVAVLEHQGVEASALEDTAPMDLFDPADSEQAIATATAVLTWVERLDQGQG